MNKFKILILVALLMVAPSFLSAQEINNASLDNDVAVDRVDAEVLDDQTNAVVEDEISNDEQRLQNLQTVTDSLGEIKEEGRRTESEVRAEIKKSIDKSILNIRSQEDIEAYELQRVVDDTRNDIYEDINKTIRNITPSSASSVRELGDRVEDAVNKIKQNLEERSGVDVDVDENITSIRDALVRYEQVIEEKRKIIEERQGDLIEKDTDNDGLSDYDEKFIYNTNPENPYTTESPETSIEEKMNDAEKIKSGINPSSPALEKIDYQDPRADRQSVISKIHKVSRVELVNVEGKTNKFLKLQGTALPNSYVTVYIFSTPTIVTVRTDARGEWSYTLDKELENGEHEVYVATVDNTGRLLARSESIPITQTTDAATLGTFGIGEPTSAQTDFIQENFILIILAILLFAIIIVLIISGSRKNKDDDDDNFGIPIQNNLN